MPRANLVIVSPRDSIVCAPQQLRARHQRFESESVPAEAPNRRTSCAQRAWRHLIKCRLPLSPWRSRSAA